jgi:hypothetical protein
MMPLVGSGGVRRQMFSSLLLNDRRAFIGRPDLNIETEGFGLGE